MTRNRALDGLRGYAAIAVVFYHAILYPIRDRADALLMQDLWSPLGWYEKLARFVLLCVEGDTAVLIFFGISGSVLMSSLLRESNRNPVSVGLNFALRRALRIYPALCGCLVGLFLVYNALHPFWPAVFPVVSWQDFLINASLYGTPIHGASWTLRAEMIAVPFILAAYFLRRYLGIAGIVTFFLYSLLTYESPALGFGAWLVNLWLMYFGAGLLSIDLARTNLLKELTRNGRWTIILGLVVFLRGLVSRNSVAAAIVQCVAMLILVAYLRSDEESALTRFLTNRFSQFAGRVSYSLYLWNVLILNCIARPLDHWQATRQHYLELGIVSGLITTALSLPIASLSERWLERPFTRVGKKAEPQSTLLPDAAINRRVTRDRAGPQVKAGSPLIR